MESTPESAASKDLAQDEIYHLLPNPDHQGPTILFIHGLNSSSYEFNRVSLHLQDDYHLILVDLPGHSKSRLTPGPYTYQRAADYVQRIIQNHAHQGKAHVVGFSLGGFVGLHLTATYPKQVRSLFVSGAAPFEGIRKWGAGQTRLMYSMSYLQNRLVPDSLYNYFCDWVGLPRHLEFRKEIAENATYTLVREHFTALSQFDSKNVEAVAKTGIKVLTVAGENGDDVDATRQMGETLRSCGSSESQAMAVKKALHPWNNQFPELFAKGVRTWIEGGNFPVEYRML
jgi:pimeloyl-ACP methyl ester carboxylesterase